MKKLVTLLALLATIGLSSTAWADMERAYDLLDAEQYEEAYREFLPHAQEGDTRAMIEVGLLFLNGNGVEQDDAQALFWINQAANARVPFAQYVLGFMTQHGRGMPADPVAAVVLYEQAANEGIIPAQTALGNLFAYGDDGISVDYETADRWYAQAMQNGDASAMNAYAWSVVVRGESALERALAISELSVALEPGRSESIDTLGTIRLLMGRYASAVKYLEEAVALDPDYPAFHARLGDAYAGIGDMDKAENAWRAALDAAEDYEGSLDELWNPEEIAARLGDEPSPEGSVPEESDADDSDAGESDAGESDADESDAGESAPQAAPSEEVEPEASTAPDDGDDTAEEPEAESDDDDAGQDGGR